MSIFTKISSYFDNRFANKIERGLRILEKRQSYNPRFMTFKNAMTDNAFTLRISENLAWYIGDENILRYHFTNLPVRVLNESVDQSLFWKTAHDVPFVHTGLPGLIANKMSNIIFSKGWDTLVEIYKSKAGTDGKAIVGDNIDEDRSDMVLGIILDTLEPEMGLLQKFKTQAEDDSWGGHTASKLNYVPELTPYPIFETFDIRNFEVIKERGITTEIVFKTYVSEKSGAGSSEKNYRVEEIYSQVHERDLEGYGDFAMSMVEGKTAEIGDAVIRYKVYWLDADREIDVPFAEWQLHAVFGLSNLKAPILIFNGLKRMLAFEKANRLPNNEFKGSAYGASDYARQTPIFDKLDELYTEGAREVRKNKSVTFAHDSLFPKDTQGKRLPLDPFQGEFVTNDSDNVMEQGGKPLLQTVNPVDRQVSLESKWKLQIGLMCALAKISPASLGLAGFESIDQSEKSQQEKKETTKETHDEKCEIWGPYIGNVLLTTLEMCSWISQNNHGVIMPGFEDFDVDFTNCNVKITFPPFSEASDLDLVNTWGAAINFKVSDIETAVSKVHRKLSTTEQEKMCARIRLDNGLSTDNPNALQMNELLKPPVAPIVPPVDDKTKTPPNTADGGTK